VAGIENAEKSSRAGLQCSSVEFSCQEANATSTDLMKKSFFLLLINATPDSTR